jgi:hypothetical protein
LAELRDKVPISLSKLVQQMLAKDSQDRLANAAEVAARLAPLCAGSDLRGIVAEAAKGRSPGGATTITPLSPPRKHAHRWRLLATIAVVALIGIAFWQWSTLPNKASLSTSSGNQPASPGLIPAGQPTIEPQDWIVDDSDPAFQVSGTEKGWRTSELAVGYDNNHHYNSQGASEAVWRIADLPTGRYSVYATWPALDPEQLARRVVYRLYDGPVETSTVTLSQKTLPSDVQFAGCGWRLLSTINIQRGSLAVKVDARDSRGPGTSRADAIRILRLDEGTDDRP